MTFARTASPGRPRQFDVDRALDAAVTLFWASGFRATTTRDLEQHLGISQSSMYRAFGTKDELLHRVIDRYESQVEEDLLIHLEAPGDGWVVLERFITELGIWIERAGGKGCLVVNLMASDSNDGPIRRRVELYRSKIRSSLRDVLQRTDTPRSAIDRRAEALLAAVLGLHLTARSAGAEEVENMLGGLRQLITDWKATG